MATRRNVSGLFALKVRERPYPEELKQSEDIMEQQGPMISFATAEVLENHDPPKLDARAYILLRALDELDK